MTFEKDSVINIATKVRQAVENTAKNINSVYLDNDTLCGWCGIASYCLYYKLKQANFKCSIWEGKYKNMGHAWIICYIDKSPYIVDITATQFGLDKIHIIEAYYKNNGYYPETQIKSLKDFDDWDKHQRPNKKTPSQCTKCM